MTEAEFTGLVMPISRKLYHVAYSILWNDADCADAVQDALAKAWVSKDKLCSYESFEAWIVRLLINTAISQLRRRKRFHLVPLEDGLEASEERAPEDIDLRNALRKLKDKYRLLLVLHYQDGYSLSEISEIMDISEKLVKSRMHQARYELKKLLGGDDYEA